MAESPLFKEIFLGLLDGLDSSLTPFERHERFCEAAFEARHSFLHYKRQKANAEASTASMLTACICALKILSAPSVNSPRFNSLLSQYPFLGDLVVRIGDRTDVSRLRAKAEELIGEAAVKEARDDYSPRSRRLPR